MRLRRLEFVIIGVTLAFICFMGGFFTGRSINSVNITAVATQNENSSAIGVEIISQATPPQSFDNQQANPPNSALQNPQSPVSQNTQPEQPNPMQPNVGAPVGDDGRININLASQTELTDLPGIGPTLASRIVDYRRQHGDFTRIEDIRNVSGIGEKRFDAIRDMITVGN